MKLKVEVEAGEGWEPGYCSSCPFSYETWTEDEDDGLECFTHCVFGNECPFVGNNLVKAEVVDMTLKDVLEKFDRSWDTIMYRTWCGEEDMLFGYCKWDNEKKELESLDGDNYSLGDVVVKYEVDEYEDEEYLVIYFESEWITGEELDKLKKM